MKEYQYLNILSTNRIKEIIQNITQILKPFGKIQAIGSFTTQTNLPTSSLDLALEINS